MVLLAALLYAPSQTLHVVLNFRDASGQLFHDLGLRPGGARSEAGRHAGPLRPGGVQGEIHRGEGVPLTLAELAGAS